MRDAVGEKTSVWLQAGQVSLLASGTRLTEKGFTALYDDQDAEPEDQALPGLEVGDRFPLKEAKAEEKRSSAPPRFTEGKFVQVMEKAGIGRPSTYGATLDTLQKRQYVALRNRQLHVTPLGLLIASYLMKQVPQLVDAQFTAQMEGDLDRIANGELGRVAYLDQIWKETLESGHPTGPTARASGQAAAGGRGARGARRRGRAGQPAQVRRVAGRGHAGGHHRADPRGVAQRPVPGEQSATGSQRNVTETGRLTLSPKEKGTVHGKAQIRLSPPFSPDLS